MPTASSRATCGSLACGVGCWSLTPCLRVGAVGSRPRTISPRTSSTGRSAPRARSAFRIRSSASCRCSSPTSCRTGPGQGYERLGFVYRGQRRRGAARSATYVEDRVPLVGLNCATCHVGTVRESPSAPRQIVLGMPAHQMDLQGYANFLTACAQDPRFEAGALIDAIRAAGSGFGWFDGLVYRFVVVKRVRDGILERAEQNSWFEDRPPQGPGRVDTFNPYKRMFGFDLKADTSVGTADLPPLFNQRPRQGLWLHWDGNNDLVEERNKSAAIGAGATPESLDLAVARSHRAVGARPAAAAVSGRPRRPRARRQGRRVYETAARSATPSAAPASGR